MKKGLLFFVFVSCLFLCIPVYAADNSSSSYDEYTTSQLICEKYPEFFSEYSYLFTDSTNATTEILNGQYMAFENNAVPVETLTHIDGHNIYKLDVFEDNSYVVYGLYDEDTNEKGQSLFPGTIASPNGSGITDSTVEYGVKKTSRAYLAIGLPGTGFGFQFNAYVQYMINKNAYDKIYQSYFNNCMGVYDAYIAGKQYDETSSSKAYVKWYFSGANSIVAGEQITVPYSMTIYVGQDSISMTYGAQT